MAHVYYAMHATLDRPLVIKVLHAHLAKDPEMRERFKREAEASSQLLHPHICPILDFADLDDLVYLVMPYMAGGSLADVLVRDKTVPAGPTATTNMQVSMYFSVAGADFLPSGDRYRRTFRVYPRPQRAIPGVVRRVARVATSSVAPISATADT